MTNTLTQNYPEQSMNLFWDNYDAGEFEPSMDVVRSLGYSALVLDYVFNPSSYYYPPTESGALIKPENVNEAKVAIFALEESETVSLPMPHSIHPLQQSLLEREGYTSERIAVMNSVFDNYPIEVSRVEGDNMTASVRTPLIQTTDGDIKKMVSSTPFVIFNKPKDFTENFICQGAILHELVHVAQYLQTSTYDSDTRLDKELEAYAVQAKLMHSRKIPYSLETAMAVHVNMFRSTHLGIHSFVATDDFKDKIEAHSVLSRIIPQPSL
jgi:hypothetical protein